MPTLGLTAGWARGLRTIIATGLSSGIVAALANIATIQDQVQSLVDNISWIDNPAVFAIIAIAAISGALTAADKFLRDEGKLPNVIDQK